MVVISGTSVGDRVKLYVTSSDILWIPFCKLEMPLPAKPTRDRNCNNEGLRAMRTEQKARNLGSKQVELMIF